MCVCLSVCIKYLKKLWTDFDEIFWRGEAWLEEELVWLWWQSSFFRDGEYVRSWCQCQWRCCWWWFSNTDCHAADNTGISCYAGHAAYIITTTFMETYVRCAMAAVATESELPLMLNVNLNLFVRHWLSWQWLRQGNGTAGMLKYLPVGLLQNWYNQLPTECVNSGTERRLRLSTHSVWCVNHQVSEST